MKTSSGYCVYALFMLLLAGYPLIPPAVAQAEKTDVPANSATGFPRPGTIKADTLNVRARPGLFYEVIAKLAANDRVQVLERQDDWYRIPIPEDAEAWVASRFVSDDNQVTGDGVRVRAGTGVAFSAYHTLDRGTSVKPTGETRDDWVRISPPPDATAWVSKQFVELLPPKIEAAAKTETAEEVKAEADKVSEAITAADDAENPGTMSEQTDDGEEAADEVVDMAEDAAERNEDAEQEKMQIAEGKTESESGSEDESEGEESRVVDLRERVRGVRTASESRGVKMLPPIRLPESKARTAVDENIRITPPLSANGEQKADTDKEADSSVVYTEVTPEEENGGMEGKADAQGAETKVRRATPEEKGSPRTGKERKKTKADKPEIPAAFRISGIVVSLGDRANEAASHVVVRSASGRMVPVAYLRSHSVDLAAWEGQRLHVYGQRIPCDWSKPLVAVSGILVAR